MKSGFNHRNVISTITMFIALLLLISAYGCRTSKSVVEKHKESFSKEELQLNKFDSVTKIDKLNKIDNSFQSQWSDFKQKLDISFNGLSNDDFFEFQFTENGFIAKGKGSVNQKTETSKKDSATNKKVDETLKENSDIRKNEVNQNKVDESKSKINKNKQNKSFGPSFNTTIIITTAVVVILILLWKFGLPNFKSK
ncbi:hypothetical protein [Empedobacter sp. GD03739]|uniref:hypothetical protein n=1 Tax=Empedobacter sp. GD03739 TaxID=2975376 RepID=UPI0024487AA1|nr:hypothetical protein [Empedobacter sp. GD03739]MDH1602379.1 hypothetical protein [Empedobacter sp. GD03739]